MLEPRTGLTAETATCVGCGRQHPLSAHSAQCNCPARDNLAIDIALGAAQARAVRASTREGPSSLWRYAPLLPVAPHHASPLSVGWTPLVDCGPAGPAQLYLKDDTRLPSGSIKDRASEVVVAVARAQGIDRLIVASTGNAAASLACIGAACAMAVTVLVPASAPPAKLAQARAYGARVHRIAGNYDDAFAMAGRIAAADGALDRSTGRNPFTREGKKSCAFEIAEQLGWQAPEWVIVPTGDGNILSAIGKGFAELVTLGLIDRLPRLVAVQAAGSDGIAARHNRAPRIPGTTIADSITVGAPRDATAALTALARSQGRALVIGDDSIRAAVATLAARYGVFAEPSSAAAYAGFEALSASGCFAPGDRVVCLITGTGLKDLRAVSAADEAAAVDPADWRRLVARG
ncbi:threonine synthase [Sphingomonas sp. MMS12-HWE2-04]|uniref:threonine synthase n=1 Tax=Sphingomonas sp. MMS12-HWE2-04 TaxID=3234199 RepID=UPI00384C3667